MDHDFVEQLCCIGVMGSQPAEIFLNNPQPKQQLSYRIPEKVKGVIPQKKFVKW